MLQVEIVVEGVEQVEGLLGRLPELVDAGLVDAIRQTDLSILERVKTSFPNGEIGTPRPRGMVGPPRRLTGNLSRSVVEIPVGGEPGARTGGVGVLGTAPYGEILETGGQYGVSAHVRSSLKGKPRAIAVRAYTVDQPAYPYIAPALESEEPFIEERIRAAIQDAVEAGTEGL